MRERRKREKKIKKSYLYDLSETVNHGICKSYTSNDLPFRLRGPTNDTSNKAQITLWRRHKNDEKIKKSQIHKRKLINFVVLFLNEHERTHTYIYTHTHTGYGPWLQTILTINCSYNWVLNYLNLFFSFFSYFFLFEFSSPFISSSAADLCSSSLFELFFFLSLFAALRSDVQYLAQCTCLTFNFLEIFFFIFEMKKLHDSYTENKKKIYIYMWKSILRLVLLMMITWMICCNLIYKFDKNSLCTFGCVAVYSFLHNISINKNWN